jgi:hypothetical protein
VRKKFAHEEGFFLLPFVHRGLGKVHVPWLDTKQSVHPILLLLKRVLVITNYDESLVLAYPWV